MILKIAVCRTDNTITSRRLPVTPVHSVCRCARLHRHRCPGRRALLQGDRPPGDCLSSIICAGGVETRCGILPCARPVHSNRTRVGRIRTGRLRVKEDVGVEQRRPLRRRAQFAINVVPRLGCIPLDAEEMILCQVWRRLHVNILVRVGAVVRSYKHGGSVRHNECSNRLGGRHDSN